jgi:hypothetical protein
MIRLRSQLQCVFRRRAAFSVLATPLPPELLPPDVDPHTGLCADGFVRIGACSTLRKGLGAYAAAPMASDFEVGRYAGEILSLGDLLERYWGGGAESPEGYEIANKQALWIADRQSRGVSVTGQYIFNAGKCPDTRRDVVLDAEDPAHANWTRFLNHSSRQPNLVVAVEVRSNPTASRGTPIIRFITSQPIAAGDELLFDYADGFELDVLDFED